MGPDLSLLSNLEGRKSPFKNSQGVYLTRQLFLELSDSGREYCLYSLRPEDHEIDGKIYPSLRRLYLELGDDTEYKFAETYFGGWPHWTKLINTPWFPSYIDPIREELKTKILSDALEQVRKKAQAGDYQANKFLLEREAKTNNPVGRPTKAKIKEEAERLVKETSIFEDDILRLKEYMT